MGNSSLAPVSIWSLCSNTDSQWSFALMVRHQLYITCVLRNLKRHSSQKVSCLNLSPSNSLLFSSKAVTGFKVYKVHTSTTLDSSDALHHQIKVDSACRQRAGVTFYNLCVCVCVKALKQHGRNTWATAEREKSLQSLAMAPHTHSFILMWRWFHHYTVSSR